MAMTQEDRAQRDRRAELRQELAERLSQPGNFLDVVLLLLGEPEQRVGPVFVYPWGLEVIVAGRARGAWIDRLERRAGDAFDLVQRFAKKQPGCARRSIDGALHWSWLFFELRWTLKQTLAERRRLRMTAAQRPVVPDTLN